MSSIIIDNIKMIVIIIIFERVKKMKNSKIKS